MGGSSVLVKPEVARRQEEEEGNRDGGGSVGPDVDPKPNGATGRTGQEGGGAAVGPGAARPLPRRHYASRKLDPIRVGRDAGRIADEVLSHLAGLPGSRLRVSIEIEAEMPEGAPEHVQRTVSEIAQVLKFETQGFEPE